MMRMVPVVLTLLLTAGCASQATRAVPAAGAEKAAAKPVSAPPVASKVNLDEIFPAGRGRELVLDNCTSCHTFVPIVTLKMTKEAWERNSRDHRGRVTALSNADFKILYEYLAANFNPERPVPTLPQELLDTWTSY